MAKRSAKPNWFKEIAPLTGNVSQLISAVAACVAVVIVTWQISTIKQINARAAEENRAAAARQMFRSHLELEIKNPIFAAAQSKEIEKLGTAGIAAYGNFVAHLLYTCEEILTVFPDENEWYNACVGRALTHVKHICITLADGDIRTYTSVVQRMINAVRQAGAIYEPECAGFRAQ